MLRPRPTGQFPRQKPTARLLAAALACGVCAGSTLAWGDGSTWQPRPLALPATSSTATAWKPPQRVAPVAPATTIVIQPPAPPVDQPEPPTPAELRQRKLQHQRSEAKRSAEENAIKYPDRPLPPSDEINLGSRRSQLAAAAVEQLRIAHWAAQRGATESARQAATQTLRTIAALRDTDVNDNVYTLELNAAFIAIRESTDFSGRYGPVDTAAIERLIEVHQTAVLKGIDSSALTSARAVEAYLNFALDRLVNATEGGPLAAEATMILADLESLAASTHRTIDSPAEHSPLHAAELALMYRRASVAIQPNNAAASAELGRTLLRRSIPGAAKDLLLQSVRVAPTRQRVESLLEAAAKSGDFVLVDQCEKQLALTTLPSELPVTVMTPQDFARTGQTVPPPMPAGSAGTMSPQYRVGSRPTQPRGGGRALPGLQPGAGEIVDPSLPQSWSSGSSAPPAPPTSGRRLFW